MPFQSELAATGLPIDIRPADPAADSLDDEMPGVVVAPRSPEGLAAAIEWASRRGLSTVVWGSGTKSGWGRVPARVDVLLRTGHLNRVLMHRPGDLTVTVEAGVTLAALNGMLSSHGQCLPLDPASGDLATIGGLLASNDSGALRHRFGTPRDLVIGIQLATTDGRLTKAGGQVVKNVAGYDLSKLMSGSFGCLAAITAATFKLSPLPEVSVTLVASGIDADALAGFATALSASQLEPVACDFHAVRGAQRSTSCLVRLWSAASAIDPQVEAMRASLASEAAEPIVAAGSAEADVWRQHAASIWQGAGAIVRVSWLPADLPVVLDLLDASGSTGAVEMIGRVGTGAGLVRIEGDSRRQIAAIEQLRASRALGSVVIVRASRAVKETIDVWGPRPNMALLQSIKRTLDPALVLGAGRGPL